MKAAGDTVGIIALRSSLHCYNFSYCYNKVEFIYNNQEGGRLFAANKCCFGLIQHLGSFSTLVT